MANSGNETPNAGLVQSSTAPCGTMGLSYSIASFLNEMPTRADVVIELAANRHVASSRGRRARAG